MRVGITGPRGFIAGHLTARLRRDGHETVTLPREAWEDAARLAAFVESCDAIAHLAGVNRGEPSEVETENAALASRLTKACVASSATPHILYASTTQRDRDTPYGRGKRRAEDNLRAWAESFGALQTTLVIPNVYGAGCRPFYNSVVATFCHQLTHGETPTVHDDRELELLWINDLVDVIAASLAKPCYEHPILRRVWGGAALRVSQLRDILDGFRRDYFERDVVPDLKTPLHSRLYGTFLSHLDLQDHRHRPPLHSDDRGDLCEVIKTDAGGQVFFSTTKPGVIRGNHYHTRKVEWFCVVRGEAVIRLRPIGNDRVTEFRVSGRRPEFISIPVLHTHSIENVGDDDLFTMFWCNELFDASDADTYAERVA